MINKIDGKLKVSISSDLERRSPVDCPFPDHTPQKLILIVTKEIDGIARAAIREELAHLDPMLAAMGAGQWES